jgi:hypothetical protein
VTGTRGRLAQLMLITVGILIFGYPLTVGAVSPISCRGVSMGHGDTCAKAGASATQSYEQRVQARRNAAPVIMVVGVSVVAFGVTLLLTGRRRVPNGR